MQVNMLDIVEFARTDGGVDTLTGIVIGFGGGMPRIARAEGYPWIGQRDEVYGRVPTNRIRRIVKPAPSFA